MTDEAKMCRLGSFFKIQVKRCLRIIKSKRCLLSVLEDGLPAHSMEVS